MNIRKQPNQQSCGYGNNDCSAENEQSSVKDGANDDAAYFGNTVRRQFKSKRDGLPFRNVEDRNFDAPRVESTDNTIMPSKTAAQRNDFAPPTADPTKIMEISAISVGNRPLQGTRLFVRSAIARSRGESIMRQPVIPQALQPKPIHMVKDCLP